jgi:predicted ABC-type ATPase
MDTPYIIVIAGPNGVGKSTFARWYLRQRPACKMIVDPDAIAKELNIPDEAQRNIAAGRIALETIDANICIRISFAIETTLSGKTLADKLEQARQAGYSIEICLLLIPSVEISAQRVVKRVRTGGHNIPADAQLRRFERSYRNFHKKYIEVCHVWNVYDATVDPPEHKGRGRGGFAAA